MADEVATPAVAEPTGIEKMMADAVSEMKGFCDSVRADMASLGGRMDAMDAARSDSAVEEVPAVETPADVPPIEDVPPATELEDIAPDAAMAEAAPVELAADTIDMSALADSAAQRATVSLRADIARLTKLVPAELTIDQRQQFATAQEQAEHAFQAFGDHAPAPMNGEGIGTYKRRLASKMQGHSDKWKGTKLTAISDDATLDVIVGDIYNDAVAVARRGSDVPMGTLSAVTRRTEAGHTIKEYRGSPGAWMRPLSGATRRATGKFNTGR